MSNYVVSLQQIRKEYVNIDFDALYTYARGRAWAKNAEHHCIVPIDDQIKAFLLKYDMYNPEHNYLMLINKTAEETT